MVLAHLSVLLIQVEEKAPNLDNVFPPDDLWFGSDNEHELHLYVITLYFFIPLTT